MAKKKAPKVPSATTKMVVKRTGSPVRLDLRSEDQERLERMARARGLSKAAYARMAVMERIKADEEKEKS